MRFFASYGKVMVYLYWQRETWTKKKKGKRKKSADLVIHGHSSVSVPAIDLFYALMIHDLRLVIHTPFNHPNFPIRYAIHNTGNFDIAGHNLP